MPSARQSRHKRFTSRVAYPRPLYSGRVATLTTMADMEFSAEVPATAASVPSSKTPYIRPSLVMELKISSRFSASVLLRMEKNSSICFNSA